MTPEAIIEHFINAGTFLQRDIYTGPLAGSLDERINVHACPRWSVDSSSPAVENRRFDTEADAVRYAVQSAFAHGASESGFHV